MLYVEPQEAYMKVYLFLTSDLVGLPSQEVMTFYDFLPSEVLECSSFFLCLCF